MMSGVKILMHWDIKPGRDQEYFEFVIREWVPRSTKLGLEMTGAWYTVYSRDTEAPQIMAEGIADNLASMRTILNSEDWKSLHEQLLEYVVNYSQKVVRVTGGFQI